MEYKKLRIDVLEEKILSLGVELPPDDTPSAEDTLDQTIHILPIQANPIQEQLDEANMLVKQLEAIIKERDQTIASLQTSYAKDTAELKNALHKK